MAALVGARHGIFPAQHAWAETPLRLCPPGYTRKDGGHSALDPEAWKRVGARAPLGKVAEPEDVAHLIAFLLSPEARYITGQAIAVDGGLALGAAP